MAAKNPVQVDAVAASAPCRDEKNVPTRAGSTEPAKIPVMFCKRTIINTLILSAMLADTVDSRR